MGTVTATDYADFYSSRWNAAFEKQDLAAALSYAIKGYLIAIDLGDVVHQNAFLGLIRSALHVMVDKPLEQRHLQANQGLRCSFCGRSEGEVRLVAGPGVTICRICNDGIRDIFAQQEQP